jgi:uncharacterized membrane protein
MPDRLRHFSVIGMGYVLGVAVFSRLPQQVARPMVAFLLPTAALVTFALLRQLGTRHLSEDHSRDFLLTYDAIMFRFLLFLTGVHATILAGLLGLLWGREWAARIVPVLLGAFLIGIGNLLPRTRPNLAIGISTSGTRSDRALWMRIHRVAGYLVVALGFLILVGGIAVPAPAGPRMGRLVEPAALLGVPALVLYSRRKIRA